MRSRKVMPHTISLISLSGFGLIGGSRWLDSKPCERYRLNRFDGRFSPDYLRRSLQAVVFSVSDPRTGVSHFGAGV